MFSSESGSCEDDDLSVASEQMLEIFDEYTQRKLSGDDPSIGEFERAYPALADRIRQVIRATDTLESAAGVPRPVPPLIAGFQVLREVGDGASGTVYEAIHPKVSRRLAIKVLDRANEKRLQRFQREAEVLSQLVHPHIVPFLDHGEEDGIAYLSMHYIDGASLAEVLQLSRDPDASLWRTAPDAAIEFAQSVVGRDFRRIAQIGADVASALSYAHSRSIVHRDIKPGNLLLDRQGKVWVSDFGLAKAEIPSHEDLTQRFVGTPRYMAPEQIRGVVSPQSDVYSLGVTLYELASGRRAWGPREQGQAEPHQAELTPLTKVAPHVDPALAKIIMRACASNAEDRYPTAAELENVLRRFAQTGKKGDRRSGKRHKNQRYIRRRPIWIGLTALAATCVVGWIWQRYDSRIDADPQSVAQAVQRNGFRDAIWSMLPDDENSDTEEAKAARKQLGDAITNLLDVAGLSPRDGDVQSAASDDFVSSFVDGEWTKEKLNRFIDSRQGVENILGSRLHLLERDVWRSDAPHKDRVDAATQLQAIQKACACGTIDPDIADRLDAVLPSIVHESWRPPEDPMACFAAVRDVVDSQANRD